MGFLDSYKISNMEQAAAKVQSAPDTLTGTAQDNKKVFDNFPELITNKLNAVIEKLGSDQNTTNNTVATNKTLMKSTNYSITDGDLKSLFGSTATLQSVLQALGARYIVETNAGYPAYTSQYRWVKYSDGIAEVEWTGAIGLGSGVSWAGGYHHTQATPATFPISFIEVPKVVEAKRNGTKLAIYCGGAMTQTTWSTVWFDGYSGSYTGGAFDNVHLLIRGRWK